MTSAVTAAAAAHHGVKAIDSTHGQVDVLMRERDALTAAAAASAEKFNQKIEQSEQNHKGLVFKLMQVQSNAPFMAFVVRRC